MKMIDNRGIAAVGLATLLVCLTIVLGVASYMILKHSDERKYEVFAQNARNFATKVASYRDGRIKYYKEIYLIDIVSDNYIKPYKNPFNGGGNCDLYESNVITVSGSERYVTLKCGDYIIENQRVSSNNYKVYKISPWQTTIPNSLEMESIKLYNYQKNGKVVLDEYVVSRELVEEYNKNERKNVKSIDDIDISEATVITKTFYRSKELVKENL